MEECKNAVIHLFVLPAWLLLWSRLRSSSRRKTAFGSYCCIGANQHFASSMLSHYVKHDMNTIQSCIRLVRDVQGSQPLLSRDRTDLQRRSLLYRRHRCFHQCDNLDAALVIEVGRSEKYMETLQLWKPLQNRLDGFLHLRLFKLVHELVRLSRNMQSECNQRRGDMFEQCNGSEPGAELMLLGVNDAHIQRK